MNCNELVIGIDEAGRGALVGPVYASCCLLNKGFNVSILNDSKKLSANKRNEARKLILSNSSYGIGFATQNEIDELNILNATFLAMQRAFEKFLIDAEKHHCNLENALIVVDGNRLPKFLKKYSEESLFNTDNPYNFKSMTLIKADSLIPSVMAASILAKTQRDNFMLFAHKKWPVYNYASHKGYGTKAHIDAIKKYGLSPIARRTFKFS